MTSTSITFPDRVRDAANFLMTNRLPRRQLTRLFGWYSKLEQPWVAQPSLALWRRVADLHLEEAEQQQFRSLHECFVRRLKPGARPLCTDADTLCSPSDAIIGACGTVREGQVLQVKGQAYPLADLLLDDGLARRHEGGLFITLRLTSSMYHRFHAPCDLQIQRVTHIPGDMWNVNPPALARVPSLFCRNERAVIRVRCQPGGEPLTLVPVAAILVASLRLHCINALLGQAYEGPRDIPCNAGVSRGEEMGWFEHGSTIIMLAPRGWQLAPGLATGMRIRMGEALVKTAAGA
ncbi:MAG: phosphatidylserine decarboxylase [Pseudomonadota bacterium]|jgi:phosphatidylserine decarboxylase